MIFSLFDVFYVVEKRLEIHHSRHESVTFASPAYNSNGSDGLDVDVTDDGRECGWLHRDYTNDIEQSLGDSNHCHPTDAQSMTPSNTLCLHDVSSQFDANGIIQWMSSKDTSDDAKECILDDTDSTVDYLTLVASSAGLSVPPTRVCKREPNQRNALRCLYLLFPHIPSALDALAEYNGQTYQPYQYQCRLTFALTRPEWLTNTKADNVSGRISGLGSRHPISSTSSTQTIE